MSELNKPVAAYDRPVKIGEDVYWVGGSQAGSHSNPYLIVDNDEAVLLDGGSRSDFSSIMLKILQTGIIPSSIIALVYQNCTPRFCGSIPHLEGLIDRNDLKIVFDKSNNLFMEHYCESAALLSLEDIGYQLRFSSGRHLEFIKTPFAHSAGSFVTFDRKSGILFSGAMFSGYNSQCSLGLKLRLGCRTCEDYTSCREKLDSCPVQSILRFHREFMSSERAIKCALDRIATLPFTIIAPQHGGIIVEPEDIIVICELLSSLKGVGIDGIIGEKSFFDLGDTSCIKERLNRNSKPETR